MAFIIYHPSLSNFAGSLTKLIFKPDYAADDFTNSALMSGK